VACVEFARLFTAIKTPLLLNHRLSLLYLIPARRNIGPRFALLFRAGLLVFLFAFVFRILRYRHREHEQEGKYDQGSFFIFVSPA